MIGAAGFKLSDEASRKALCKMVESIPGEVRPQRRMGARRGGHM